jgi:hypothetical protein
MSVINAVFGCDIDLKFLCVWCWVDFDDNLCEWMNVPFGGVICNELSS